jgi:hypothetical protein
VARFSGRRRSAVEWLVAVAVAAVVLGPALLPGYLLRIDLVSVPRPVLGTDALGLGDRVPRSVPWDAAVATVARVVPDGLVTQIAALLALSAAGAGAARLARSAGPGRWISLLVAIWNPFVLEQLSLGHVPHLVSYGALPWVLLAADDLARGRPGAWPSLAVPLAAGSLTPGGGLLLVGAVVAVTLAQWPGSRRAALAIGTAAAAQAPWVVAGLAHVSAATAAGAGAAVFATRAESSLGVVVDTLGLGGVWAQSALPASRSTILAPACTLLLLGLVAAGGGEVLRRHGRHPLLKACAALAAAGYLVALMPHLPGGEPLLTWLSQTLPGAGILRDGHRWLAWPALAIAVLAGHGARRLAVRPDGTPRLRWGVAPVLALVGCAVVAVLPDLAGGLAGRLRPSDYPPDWAAVRAALNARPDRDRVLVLPWQPFRRFAWAGPRSMLDPAPRLLPRPTLVDDALPVDGVRLPGEGLGSRGVAVDLADGALSADQAVRLGIGWVLVEHGTPGAVARLPGDARPVVDGPDLTLYRLADPPDPVEIPPLRLLAVIAAHVALLAVLVLGVIGHGVITWRRRASRRWLLPGSVRRARL